MAGERANREVEVGGRLRLLITQVTAKHLVFQNQIPLWGEQAKQKHFRENRFLIYLPFPGLSRNQYMG